MTTSRARRVLGDAALSAAALLGVLGLVLVAAGTVGGVRPLLFRSGSMSPTIGTGDLALSRSVPASALHVGDIVSVIEADGHRVTHRVAAVSGDGPLRRLRLRGDANGVADKQAYVVRGADRVFFVLHGGGRVIALAEGPAGMFVLGLYVAVLLRLLLRRPGPPPRRRGDQQHRHRGPRRRAPVMVGATVATAVVLVPSGSADAAAWPDAVPITGQPLTAATVPATTLSCTGSLLLQVTLNWTAVAGATSYTVHYGAGGSSTTSTTGTSLTLTAAVSGGSAWVDVVRAFGATTWTSAPSHTISYAIVVAGVC